MWLIARGRWGAVLLLALWTLPGLVSASAWTYRALRQCPQADCGEYALSDVWVHCPFCGIRLPALDQTAPLALTEEELILGNKYLNGETGFQIERPDQEWTFLTAGSALDEVNEDATVGLASPDDLYTIVIVERLPEVSLEEYAQLVEPEIDVRRKRVHEEVTIDGARGLRLRWEGEINGFPVLYYQLILSIGGWKYQVISWCALSQASPAARAAFTAIEDSFRLLARRADPGPAAAGEERVAPPESPTTGNPAAPERP